VVIWALQFCALNNPIEKVVKSEAARAVEKLQKTDNNTATTVKETELLPYFAAGRRISSMKNRRALECSGLAASRINPGVFWTHNDSGGAPELFAFDRTGKDLGCFPVEGRLRDWEDICTFKREGVGYLVVADTGDNARQYKSSTIYIYQEPRLLSDAGQLLSDPQAPGLIETISFSYSDGQGHDGESIATDPSGEDIIIVGRNRSGYGCGVFLLQRYSDPKKRRLKEKQVAIKIADLDLINASAMDVSPDGRLVIVGTYGPAWAWGRTPGQKWSQVFAGKSQGIACPRRYKGEGLTISPADGSIFLNSEGVPSPLYHLPRSRQQATP
jgi:hypothetical protein